MNLGGWIFMTLSVGCVWGLAIWCYYRTFKAGSKSDQNI